MVIEQNGASALKLFVGNGLSTRGRRNNRRLLAVELSISAPLAFIISWWNITLKIAAFWLHTSVVSLRRPRFKVSQIPETIAAEEAHIIFIGINISSICLLASRDIFSNKCRVFSLTNVDFLSSVDLEKAEEQQGGNVQ